MKLQFHIQRQEAGGAPRYEDYPVETDREDATVAYALEALNEGLKDPVEWERSCLQKKCGACAMRIQGRPRLACDTFLREFPEGGTVTLEPLRKFPVVRDLIVDRSAMRERLRDMALYLSGPAVPDEKKESLAYDASRCLQCGLCLEVCPNYYAGGDFSGLAGAVPSARLIAVSGREEKALRRSYRRGFFEGCGKSLACRDICPAGLPVERLLSRTNGAAVWKLLR